jgi:hypothetical protein
MALLPRIHTDPDPTIAGVNPFRDFWDYIRTDRPHRWPAMGLAVAVPALVFYFILRGANPVEEHKRQIIYVQSWAADRSDFDIRRDWLLRARAANDRNQRRREAYGSFAKSIGQDFDKQSADAEFDEARAQIDQAMAALDHAEANHLPLPPLPRRAAEPAAGAPAAARAPAHAAAPQAQSR